MSFYTLSNAGKRLRSKARLNKIKLSIVCILGLYCYFHFDSKSPGPGGWKLGTFTLAPDTHSVQKDRPSYSPNEPPLGCVIPVLPVDAPDIMQFKEDAPPLRCDAEPDWVQVEGHRVFLTKKALADHGSNTTCAFTEDLRVDDHNNKDGATFNGVGFNLTTSDDVRVACEGGDGSTWSSMMMGIRQGVATGPVADGGMGLSVAMIGIDSLSHNTFIRQLPLTYRYLTEVLGAVVLDGYNIVGDGTPQALTPMLTGQTELELPEVRKRKENADFVNVYPFSWNDFKKAGYKTMYMEDCPDIGTYTYRLNGFKKQPTDHYGRPFFISFNKQGKDHERLCIRSKPKHKVYLDQIYNFMSTYRNERSFAFTIHGELSHDDFNLVSVADRDLLAFLTRINEEGLLDKTLLVVYADHGHRFSKVRNTQQGRQEERKPIVSLRVPPTFKKTNPIEYKNLVQNSQRLTSPFDMYSTLQHVLAFPGEPPITKRSISLFRPIPASRTCADCDIEPHWCACLSWTPLRPADERAQAAAAAMLRGLNAFTDPQRDRCYALRLAKVTAAAVMVPTRGLMDFEKNADMDGFEAQMGANRPVTEEVYQVKAITSPGGLEYEATLKYDVLKKTFETRLKTTDISVVSTYGDMTKCVETVDTSLLRFCVCKDRVEDTAGGR